VILLVKRFGVAGVSEQFVDAHAHFGKLVGLKIGE